MIKIILSFIVVSFCFMTSAWSQELILDSTHVAPILPGSLSHPSAQAAAEQFTAERTQNQQSFRNQMLTQLQNYNRRIAGVRTIAVRSGKASAIEAIDQQITNLESVIQEWENSAASRMGLENLIAAGMANNEMSDTTKVLKTQADRIDQLHYRNEHKAVSNYINQLNDIIVTLIKDNNLDEARLVEMEKTRRSVEAEQLIDLRNAGGWEVIFRSDDPAIWNTNTQNAEHLSVAIGNRYPFDGFLRLSRIDTGDAVILQLKTANLAETSKAGQYIWHIGKRESKRLPDGKIVHLQLLGIADTNHKLGYHSPLNAVVDLPGRGNGYGGWGFARRSLLHSDQQYAWGEKPIGNPTVFEISLKTKPLSRDEMKSLLNP